MCRWILPKFIFKVERWKWNKEYRIYASTMGHFRDEHKRLLPVKTSNHGYLLVNTDRGYKQAHRIVMLTWKPIPDAENLTVDHLDHNKRNNTIYNLEWVSQEENLARARADVAIEVHDSVDKEYDTPGYWYGKSHRFATLDEAAEWVLENYIHDAADPEVIKRRIKNAASNHKMYCGAKWRIK